jgi:tetratricopeptide (TPR) repeat protein
MVPAGLPAATGDVPTAAMATNAAAPKVAEDAGGFTSDDPAHLSADIVLNEARANLGDAAAVRQRIARLEGVLARFPDYKFRADAFYFIGLNAEALGEHERAVHAFESALQVEPGIANETPILSYLRAARSHTFRRAADGVLLALLAAALLPALFCLLRPDAADLPWRRLFAVYGAALAVWALLVALLPVFAGPLRIGLDPFPKPVLTNFRLGQIGDGPLRALFGYGAGAILATLPVVAACARMRCPVGRRVLTGLGTVAVLAAVLGLYAVRHLYVNARFQREGARLVFFVRSIDSMKEVPDAMLPLYDEKFAKRVIEARKQAQKPNP